MQDGGGEVWRVEAACQWEESASSCYFLLSPVLSPV